MTTYYKVSMVQYGMYGIVVYFLSIQYVYVSVYIYGKVPTVQIEDEDRLTTLSRMNNLYRMKFYSLFKLPDIQEDYSFAANCMG